MQGSFLKDWDCVTHPLKTFALVERFKSSFQISKSSWVFEKDVAAKYSLRLPQLEYTRFPRAANEPPRGLWDCDYSPHRKNFAGIA